LPPLPAPVPAALALSCLVTIRCRFLALSTLTAAGLLHSGQVSDAASPGDHAPQNLRGIPMNLRAKLVCSIGLLAMLSLMLPGSLRADSYTYTYTGNPFGYNGSVYPLTGVSGSFTLSSPLAFGTTTDLAPGTVGSPVASYSFTDGQSSWALGNFVLAPPAYSFGPQNAFSVTTDASGQITAWDITVYSGLYPSGGWIFTCNEGAACSAGLSQDGVNNWNFDYNADLGGGGVYGSYSQGSWVSPVVSTPEPSSLLLLSIGLLGLLVVAGRRRFDAAWQAFRRFDGFARSYQLRFAVAERPSQT